MQTKLIRNRMPEMRLEIPKRVQSRLLEAAVELRDTLRDDLKAGALPIQSDTGALADSLSVQNGGPNGAFSDSQVRTQAAKADYLKGTSRYEDAVKASVSGAAYTSGHFDERVASEDSLPDGIAAAVFTLLAWGLWWETGHNNQFTGHDEPPRAWMQPVVMRWWQSEFNKHFVALMK